MGIIDPILYALNIRTIAIVIAFISIGDLTPFTLILGIIHFWSIGICANYNGSYQAPPVLATALANITPIIAIVGAIVIYL